MMFIDLLMKNHEILTFRIAIYKKLNKLYILLVFCTEIG